MHRFTPTKIDGNLGFLLLISILLLSSPSRCCLERERAALLQLKAHLMSLIPASSGSSMDGGRDYLIDVIGSWGDEEAPDCCSWNRVSCNGTLQHVTALSLGFLYPFDSFYAVNISLFQPFEELRSLDLSGNYFGGFVGHRAGDRDLNFRNLEIFEFGFNNVIHHPEQLVDFITSLTSLEKLFWPANGLELSFVKKVLLNLKQLQELDLSDNYMTMNMTMNELFSGTSFLTALPNWKELHVLALNDNSITGSLSKQSEGFFCAMQNLQELHLMENSISGNLPGCISNLTSLRVLDLSNNNLSGDIPPIFQNLKSLESLSILGNSFSGEFSLNSLLNYSNLGVLVLSNNNHLNVKLEDPLHYSSHFQPQILGLSNCNLNIHQRSFLKFLSQMRDLQALDISHNGLVGSFPSWLLLNNSNLEVIMMRNNSFGGVLRLPTDWNRSLIALDVSENNFSGIFPENIGILYPLLQYVNASGNNFQGKIPGSVGNMTTLSDFDLSNNHFSGEVPRRLLTTCGDLRYLKLSNNNLEGEIIPSYMNLTSLEVFYLDGNHFTGTITNGVLANNDVTGPMLWYMDISNNDVTSDIPSWIGNFSSLFSILSFSNNHLKGQIPSEICKLVGLSYLDLSNNGLTGTIPSCYNHSRLYSLQLHNNFLSGSIPHGLTRTTSLTTLDLSGNRLSGGVPLGISNLSGLNILLLGHNSLGGELPESLCQLEKINIMDLSSNDISGSIPACFANMSFGVINTLLDHDFESSIGFAFLPVLANWLYPESMQGADQEEVVALLTKSRYYDYKGSILSIMSMLDLSCNRITGKIPKELGQLSKLVTLNLSHNQLYGSIPSSFSMLRSIESLDLSYNNLSGAIPFQLAQVTFVGTFNVSYNNLSGTVPEAGQFGSFDERNYMGNPYLCGFSGKSCMNTSMINFSRDQEDDGPTSNDGFDWQVFFWSFGMSSITLFVTVLVVLSINPQWRRAWFLFSDLHLVW